MKTCPSCGTAESPQADPFVGAFCTECYAQRHTLYEFRERRLSFERCSKCRRIKLRSQWVSPNKGAILRFVASKIKSARPFRVDEKAFSVEYSGNEIRVGGTLVFEVGEGAEVRKDVATTVVLDPATCEECSRRSGGYYEAIVQLRGDPAKVEKAAEGLGRKISGESFIAKVEVRKEGIDLYAGSDAKTRSVLGAMGLAYTSAKKQAGARNGKTLYRTTYCVRL